MKIRTYLTNLITEKGVSIHADIIIEGHYGLTWMDLINFIEPMPSQYHENIKDTLVKIDFHNGDVFHYLQHLAVGMIKASGY